MVYRQSSHSSPPSSLPRSAITATCLARLARSRVTLGPEPERCVPRHYSTHTVTLPLRPDSLKVPHGLLLLLLASAAAAEARRTLVRAQVWDSGPSHTGPSIPRPSELSPHLCPASLEVRHGLLLLLLAHAAMHQATADPEVPQEPLLEVREELKLGSRCPHVRGDLGFLDEREHDEGAAPRQHLILQHLRQDKDRTRTPCVAVLTLGGDVSHLKEG